MYLVVTALWIVGSEVLTLLGLWALARLMRRSSVKRS